MEILEFINQYVGIITLVFTGCGTVAFWWLRNNFFTKKESKENNQKLSDRLTKLEKSSNTIECYLKNFPDAKDLQELGVLAENLRGQIETQSAKFEGLEEKIDILASNIRMLTEYHLKG